MDFCRHICQAPVTPPKMPDCLAAPCLPSTFSLQEQLLKVWSFILIQDFLLDTTGSFNWISNVFVESRPWCTVGRRLFSAQLSPSEDGNRRRRPDWDLALVSKEDTTHTSHVHTNPYCTGSSQIAAILLVNVWTTKLPCLGEKHQWTQSWKGWAYETQSNEVNHSNQILEKVQFGSIVKNQTKG